MRRKLKDSFRYKVEGDWLQVWSLSPYARIQDVGDTITPTIKQALLIPRKGWSKAKIANLWANKKTVVLPSSTRGIDVIIKKYRGARLVPMQGRKDWGQVIGWLADEVTIKGKNYSRYAQMAATPRINEMLKEVLEEIKDG